MTLLDRTHELDTLAALLDGANGDGRVGLIEGPAGIGKTRLLAATRDRAMDQGFRCLTARGSELEVEFPFGVVRQLFEPIVASEDGKAALSGAAEPAGSVFDAPGTQDGGEGSSFATLHGLWWLALNLASEGRLLLAVDDLHWCDRPSLRFLAYLVRRLEGVPIVVGATLRSTEPGTDAGLLAEIAQDHATIHVRPGPLGAATVAHLVEERLGTTAAPEFGLACFEATGGNPLLLEQLLTALATEGVEPAARNAALVRDIGPRAVSRSVLLRMRRLTPEAIAVAQAVAVLGDGADIRSIAGLAGLEPGAAGEATGALARAEILRPEPPIGFVHPLVRDAVYAELPPGERALRHARAAEVLRDVGAGDEQVAAQLLLSPPSGEAWVSRLLQQTGRAAQRRGTPEGAIAYLRRALQEPPPDEHRPQLVLELGMAESLTNAPASISHLTEAFETLSDPVAKGLTANILGRALLFSGDPAAGMTVARRAYEELPEELVDLRLSLQAFELIGFFFDVGNRLDLSDAPHIAGALDLDRPAPVRLGEKMLAAIAAMYHAQAGAPAERCAALALSALEDGELIQADNGLMSIAAIYVLVMCDRDEALDAWEYALADAHRRGSLFSVSSIHLWRGFTLYRRGELAEGERSLREFMDEIDDYGYGEGAKIYGAAFLAAVMYERGDVAAAREALEQVRRPSDASNGSRFWYASELELLLAEGRDDDVIARADEFAARYGWARTPIFARWRSAKARALARRDGESARDEVLALLTEELELARGFGAPGALGTSLIMLAEHDRERATELLEEAIAVLEDSPAKVELAKALCALGTALRLERKATKAREPLRRALELATVCGADGLADRARTELHATGARPRREALSGAGSLTPSERRVADLAAEGMTNREIAQALYVTPKTVEVHLSNAYRKLEIPGRRQLASALA
jgi:DNA-binding CsgD family transcriptional regulator/tetratricopeptide (TPR) repeat protein